METMQIKIAKHTAERPAQDEAKSLIPAGGASMTAPGWEIVGVPFGGPVMGRDLDGEAFHPDTNIWLKVGDMVNLTYYHGYGPDSPDTWQDPPVIIGRATYTGADERGHLFEPEFDPTEPLAQRLLSANPDTIRASSGAVAHLVRKSSGGLIDVWPVGELALFDINEWRLPANDYAKVTAKAVQTEGETQADVIRVEPVLGSDEPIPAAKAANLTEIIPQMETEMPKIDEEIVEETVETPVEDTPEVKALKEEIEALKKAQPGKEKGAPVVTKSPKQSASFGKALIAWAQGDAPAGFPRKNEVTLYPESAKGAWEGGTDNEGGYTVPDDFYNGIVEQRTAASWVRQAPVQRFTTTRDRILIPTEATAATKLVVTDEEAAYDENEPVFGQVALTIYKFTKMLKISEELMDGDGVGLESYLSSSIARASAAAENYYLTVGTGGGMPQGVLTGATASGITSASATAITAAELIQVLGTLDTQYMTGSAGLLMTGATKFYLQSLTGNPFQFVQTPQGGDFVGYPAILSPDMESIAATKKPVLFGDFSMYAFAERQGLTIMRNPYLYQANGQMGIFVKQRFGGATLQTLAFKYLTQHA